MICIQTDIPQEICDIDDELKAIYHSKDTVCIWVFKTREDRNRFMDETTGMLKDDRKNDSLKHWLFDSGGEETINSYSSKKEFYKQLDFLKSLPLYIKYKDFRTKDNRYLVVSHSSVGKVWELRKSKKEEDKNKFENQLLWSRYKDTDNPKIFNVYGHTIFEKPVITKYSSAIDLGCYQSKDKVSNPRLCALEFPSMRVITQESLETKKS